MMFSTHPVANLSFDEVASLRSISSQEDDATNTLAFQVKKLMQLIL